jgi:putative SOS response-associated peptidase YedK
MALAGLWENCKSPAEEWVRSFTILTTTPDALSAEIHHYMTVILPPKAWPTWLGDGPGDPTNSRPRWHPIQLRQ